jgi:hypothetical protein
MRINSKYGKVMNGKKERSQALRLARRAERPKLNLTPPCRVQGEDVSCASQCHPPCGIGTPKRDPEFVVAAKLRTKDWDPRFG